MLSLASMCFFLASASRDHTDARHLVMEALVLYVTHKHSQQCRLSKYLEKGKGRKRGRAKVKAVVKFSELRSRSCLISALAAGGRRQCTIDFAACAQRQIRSDNCDEDSGTRGQRDTENSSGTLHRTVLHYICISSRQPGPAKCALWPKRQKAETETETEILKPKADCHFVMLATVECLLLCGKFVEKSSSRSVHSDSKCRNAGQG